MSNAPDLTGAFRAAAAPAPAPPTPRGAQTLFGTALADFAVKVKASAARAGVPGLCAVHIPAIAADMGRAVGDPFVADLLAAEAAGLLVLHRGETTGVLSVCSGACARPPSPDPLPAGELLREVGATAPSSTARRVSVALALGGRMSAAQDLDTETVTGFASVPAILFAGLVADGENNDPINGLDVLAAVIEEIDSLQLVFAAGEAKISTFTVSTLLEGLHRRAVCADQLLRRAHFAGKAGAR